MAEQFGTYQLLEKIGQGGMAEIFVARQGGGLAGFKKKVAIKRIFPHLMEREDLVHMFFDEARIAADLNHPNIVQVYDLGRYDQWVYIAMEYVEGHDLRKVCERGVDAADFIPKELAAWVISQAAAGLHFAHTRADSRGEPMKIVHRDISPQNILLSQAGHVKVCDFGIAKAEDRLSRTRTGQFKGKLAYMSPEQIEGKDVDRRADVFALGIVLYETTLQRRLFGGYSDFETMSMVVEAEIPRPREVDPSFPSELEQILLRALSRDPEDRYQDAEQMQLALETWLQAGSTPVGSAQLARYLRSLFSSAAPETSHQPKSTQAAQAAYQLPETAPIASTAPDAAPTGPPAAPVAPPNASLAPRAPKPARPPESAQQADLGAVEPRGAIPDSFDDDISDFVDHRTRWFALGGVAVALLVAAWVGSSLEVYKPETLQIDGKAEAQLARQLADLPDEAPISLPTVSAPMTSSPPQAAVVVNGRLTDSPTPGEYELVAGRANEVWIIHPAHPPERLIVDGEPGAAVNVDLGAFDAEPKTGRLRVQSDPAGALAFVNGERVGPTPVVVDDLVVGVEHHVEVRRSGLHPSAALVELMDADDNTLELTLTSLDSRAADRFVEVTVDPVPSNASVHINGEARGQGRFVGHERRGELLHIRLEAPHYEAMDRYVHAAHIGAVKLRPFMTKKVRARGVVSLSFEPGATFYLESTEYDEREARAIEAYEGKHTLVVVREGGERLKTRLEVLPREKTSYDLSIVNGELVARPSE